jgi:hypothetical protein
MGLGSFIGAGLSIIQGMQDKKAANKAARSNAAVSEKNARIIERDIDIANRQIQILRDNLSISTQRKGRGFSAVQGTVRNVSLASGVTSRGTPQDVLIRNAAEFEYELAIDEFNTEIAILEQQDLIEETKLKAEVTRMGGKAESSAIRASGTQSLLKGLGTGVAIADADGMFESGYWDSLKRDFS